MRRIRWFVGIAASIAVLLALPLVANALFDAEQANFYATDGTSQEWFGYSVAISGDTAIVGVPYTERGNEHQGAAYVFTRTNDVWDLQAELTAEDAAAYDEFGWSVAISGDTAIVGADNRAVGGVAGQGSAYVFVRSGTTWSQQAILTASDGAASDWFGFSVALYGDTAVVGATQHDMPGLADAGAAYLFIRSGTSWSQESTLTASDAAANDRFGASVAVSNGTAVVGAKLHDTGGNADQGAAYVFADTEAGWSQQATLTADDASASDYFGSSVAVDGDTALVGAEQDEVKEDFHRGSAYVYARTGTTWSQAAHFEASDGQPYDGFGHSVALSGDTAIIGAPWKTLSSFPAVPPYSSAGEAYVFGRSAGVWGERLQQVAYGPASGDQFGSAVAISNVTAIAGVPTDDFDLAVDRGTARVFLAAAPTSLSLATKSNASLAYGSKVALTGTLALTGPLNGPELETGVQQVQLQTSANGATFSNSVCATTTSSGGYAFSVAPTSKTWYRVVYRGSGGLSPSSPTSAIYLVPRVSVTTPVCASTMYRTRYYAAYGYLKPRHTSGTYPVWIYKYRYVNGAWRSYGYVKAKASNYSSYSKYAVSLRLPYAGKWRLRAYAPLDGGHATSWSSGYKYVTVK